MKIVIPQKMLEAAYEYCPSSFAMPTVRAMLEAALYWLHANPIIPTRKQEHELHLWWSKQNRTDSIHPIEDQILGSIIEWQRRMFLAPEPEMPEEIKDLLLSEEPSSEAFFRPDIYNERILAAYRRGKESK